MKKIFLLLSCFIASFLFFNLSLAAETSTNTPEALILKTANNNVVIQQQFDSIDNLKGFVIKPKNGGSQSAIIYADKDGKYMFIGTLIKADGTDLSREDTVKYIQSKVNKDAYQDVKTTSWFYQGKPDAKNKVYVIADPNCIYCHHLYDYFKPYIDKGELGVRWILVGIVKPSSLDKAAAIVDAKDPAAAFDQNEADFKAGKADAANMPKPSATALEALNKNKAFMAKYGFAGTPVLIYKDNKGEPQTIWGLPRENDLKNIVTTMNVD